PRPGGAPDPRRHPDHHPGVLQRADRLPLPLRPGSGAGGGGARAAPGRRAQGRGGAVKVLASGLREGDRHLCPRGDTGVSLRVEGSPLRMLVVTAAYPSPSEPTRAIFIENLCRELARLAAPGGGPRFRLTVLAPRIRSEDPAEE